MDFQLRNRLLVLLEDDATAFDIASKFVTNDETMQVFERKYHQHLSGSVQERTSTSVDAAKSLWDKCYSQASGV
jgi:hypothetical protein